MPWLAAYPGTSRAPCQAHYARCYDPGCRFVGSLSVPSSRKAWQDIGLANAEPCPPCSCGGGAGSGVKRLTRERLRLEPRALVMLRY